MNVRDHNTKFPSRPDASSLLECGPEAGVGVDETSVIASLFGEETGRERFMLDVGAHDGSSASHFADLGWRVICFEPDAENRTKRLAKRFEDTPNVIIDARAVSDRKSYNVPFFASGESSGISGLHAFRETHRQTGLVSTTTIADIVEEYGIGAIDFLKIDVEGFDFAVLKGVPWDMMKPCVIECEYEDAKTKPLGHDWRVIAEFLRDKGYAVYISEWRPIVRYGAVHDWRRVAPYPGVSVPTNSWGNILAFQNDPGHDRLRAAFAAQVRPHSDARRPAYAGFGDWLNAAAPGVFYPLRHVWRACAGMWRNKA